MNYTFLSENIMVQGTGLTVQGIALRREPCALYHYEIF